MTLADVQAHTFNRHRKAVSDISNALHTLDYELRAVARNAQLQPGDKARREQEARSKAHRAVSQARDALGQALKDDRSLSRYADIPAGETLQRRAYWQQQARTDLTGLRADEAVVVVRQVLDSGDLERAREYLRVARPVVQGSQYVGELKAAELDAMPPEEKAHRVFAAGIEAVEAQLPWLDRWTGQLLEVAGAMPEGARLGWGEEPAPLDTRQVTLWFDDAQKGAGAAGERELAALNGREPAAWARPDQGPAPVAGSAADAGQGGASGVGA